MMRDTWFVISLFTSHVSRIVYLCGAYGSDPQKTVAARFAAGPADAPCAQPPPARIAAAAPGSDYRWPCDRPGAPGRADRRRVRSTVDSQPPGRPGGQRDAVAWRLLARAPRRDRAPAHAKSSADQHVPC